MAKSITAYKGDDGVIYETYEQAITAELCAAVKHLMSMEESHVMNVAFGKSACTQTREAIKLIAERLPADHAVSDRTE